MSSLDEALQARLGFVHERISAAARAAGRDPASITLVAVSKTFGPGPVLAAVRSGQRSFGESYAQEAVDKISRVGEAAPGVALDWHFIGPLQSNKTRAVAEHFTWVHSVDREKLAGRLSEHRPAEMSPLNVLLQVNISAEPTKSGVAPRDVLELARKVADLPRLRLRGLMAIPAPEAEAPAQRRPFARMHELLRSLQRAGLEVDTLSMGMSDDLEAAILEGSTLVRVGTAIFGARSG